MPMTALPVKKKPTIAGRTCTSLVKNRLRVGVCNAPAMPVRKATIRKAEEVKSNPRRGRAALLFCMGGYLYFEQRSLRRHSENEQ
jgi:hypothetical protein